MKLEITKEWLEKRAALEGDSEIGAGLPTYVPPFIPSEADRYYGAIISKMQAALASHTSALAERDAEIEALKEKLFESEEIVKERDDRMALVDRIADLIGLPHDQELDQVAFELWFSENRSEIERLRELAVTAADQLARVHDDAFNQAAGYGLVTFDGREFSCLELNKCETVARQVRAALSKEHADG